MAPITLIPPFVLDIMRLVGMGVPVNTNTPQSPNRTGAGQRGRASPSPTEPARATFEKSSDLFGLIYLDLLGGATTAKEDGSGFTSFRPPLFGWSLPRLRDHRPAAKPPIRFHKFGWIYLDPRTMKALAGNSPAGEGNGSTWRDYRKAGKEIPLQCFSFFPH
jgi:hypothetical protein